ncbi:hypothetical protein P168DRAFT_15863 [Aspergillus campestris IBT 28561]|uniref:Uncharacterized protein n=1 Tax=Aspergillus campestris (strain IBT 28561) TaxID=1392248 RepID=A0A2I1DEV1_ASPC2|nr:uncharacterized protein P168DRAFT_15863 [Aspergillus campestris IBT 28561]PKY08388.1 hypothetical protein P168DRAFT_15863 [Aspergillus campestris IBT 28561]
MFFEPFGMAFCCDIPGYYSLFALLVIVVIIAVCVLAFHTHFISLLLVFSLPFSLPPFSYLHYYTHLDLTWNDHRNGTPSSSRVLLRMI